VERIIRDIEESDELLEQDVEDSVSFWEKKQREVVTSVVDYNLQTLTDLVTDDTIDLSPQYQRRLRWDDKRQSQLIESFLMNVPVPPIFLNEDDYSAIAHHVDEKEMWQQMRQREHRSLLIDGIEKARGGVTSFGEVARANAVSASYETIDLMGSPARDSYGRQEKQ